MIGVCIGEETIALEFYPRFTDHTKFGFRIRVPYKSSYNYWGEYGVAWSRNFSMWTMWGGSCYPRNPISLFVAYLIKQNKGK